MLLVWILVVNIFVRSMKCYRAPAKPSGSLVTKYRTVHWQPTLITWLHAINWAIQWWSHSVPQTNSCYCIFVITSLVSHDRHSSHRTWIQRKCNPRYVLTVRCDFDVIWLVTRFLSNLSYPPVTRHRSFMLENNRFLLALVKAANCCLNRRIL